MDSNLQFREASPPAGSRQCGWLHSAVSGGAASRRKSSIDLPGPTLFG